MRVATLFVVAAIALSLGAGCSGEGPEGDCKPGDAEVNGSIFGLMAILLSSSSCVGLGLLLMPMLFIFASNLAKKSSEESESSVAKYAMPIEAGDSQSNPCFYYYTCCLTKMRKRE